eukprot:GHRQ01015383.1.p1 GENE.GHRQ01015383.1~~GHRQ01015383.1.p1  ORF type:complete len:144 (-),score=11.94 GHRQ01015383.1:73-504(-)
MHVEQEMHGLAGSLKHRICHAAHCLVLASHTEPPRHSTLNRHNRNNAWMSTEVMGRPPCAKEGHCRLNVCNSEVAQECTHPARAGKASAPHPKMAQSTCAPDGCFGIIHVSDSSSSEVLAVPRHHCGLLLPQLLHHLRVVLQR